MYVFGMYVCMHVFVMSVSMYLVCMCVFGMYMCAWYVCMYVFGVYVCGTYGCMYLVVCKYVFGFTRSYLWNAGSFSCGMRDLVP